MSRFSENIPTILIVVGFIMIFLGWNGAASLDYVQGQIPYMISGGIVGLALIFFGATGLVVKTIKRSQASQEELLRELTVSVARLSTSMAIANNGHVEDGELVIAGSRSFHLADCRIVKGRVGLAKLPRDEAVSEGLEPCRICDP